MKKQQQCSLCGGWSCNVCKDCGNVSHVNGGWPFCPHPMSNLKSGYESFTDTLSFPQDEHITSPAQFDGLMKKYKLEPRGGYRMPKRKPTSVYDPKSKHWR